MQRTPMKAFLALLAAALGAAALLVVCGACSGDPAFSELTPRSEETGVEDDCAVCLLFDLDFDLQTDDD